VCCICAKIKKRSGEEKKRVLYMSIRTHKKQNETRDARKRERVFAQDI
jgi:hypothetical protein